MCLLQCEELSGGNVTAQLRILLADDNDMILRQLKALLEARPGWQAIAEARDGRSSVEKVKELKPDVVILDFSMPGWNGIDATQQIVKVSPAPKTLILTAYASDELVARALEAGADGCLLKSGAVRDLVAAVEALASREVPYLEGRGLAPVLPREGYEQEG